MDPRTTLSPKVVATAIVGFLVTAIGSNITAVTPEMFNFLGPWKLFWFGVFLTAASTAGAWFKSDPLRLPQPPATQEKPGAVSEPAKQTSLAATATNDTEPATAPATTYPAARVDAATQAPPVTPLIPGAPATGPTDTPVTPATAP